MIKEISFNQKYEAPVVLCLGRFECLHNGHKMIISRAVSAAKKLGAEVAVMTFDADFTRKTGVILNYEERKRMLETLGVSLVLHIVFDDTFKNLTKEEFLATLKNSLNLKAVCSGFDFCFGYMRGGDVDYLKSFFKGEAEVSVTDKVDYKGEKISATRIKDELLLGNIESANQMLGYPYFFEGIVKKGREEGRNLGFPTANVVFPTEKVMPKQGVYITRVTVRGDSFPAITNIGSAPTFGVDKILTESYLIGFSSDIYGEPIKVEIMDYSRDIRRFSSINELKEELKSNELAAINYFKNGAK